MKLVIPACLILALSACEAKPDPKPDTFAADTAQVLDFTGLGGDKTTVEEFVKRCQRVSGFNFTYTSTTQAALASKPMHYMGEPGVLAADFEPFLAAQLEQRGFTTKRVGAEHLRVILIEPRSS